MRKIMMVLPLFANLVFAKIDVNQASKHELIRDGKLSSQSADLIIDYRQNSTISSAHELKNLLKSTQSSQSFGEIFKFEQGNKKKIIKKVTPYNPSQPFTITEKKIITPYGYKKISQYGDLTINKTSNYPYYQRCNGKKCKIKTHKTPRYKKYQDSDFDHNEIKINGEIRIRIDKKF